MSTEKLPFKLPLRPDATADVVDSDGNYVFMAHGFNRENREANRNALIKIINALAGIPDPEAAIKAAREALVEGRKHLIFDQSQKNIGEVEKAVIQMSIDKMTNTLSLLNAKGER